MVKEKKILIYFISFLLGLLTTMLIGISDVFAATYDTFDVTWYYRNKSNENTLLNVVKNQDTALYASTSEYVNGYTTRLEQTFSKDIQYIINYELQMSFSPEQELFYRSDTLDRIINYSYTDSDFKILNVTATEDWNRSISIGDTFLTIKVSMQVLALNNTNAIRFGVYTTNNISIGFYNHTKQIDYYLLDNISIEENANATIIDQNNQIIQGQDGINNNITNSTNTITGSITETEDNINQNIDDMEDAIIDSNNQTQEVIKDQFNSCRDSYNLLNLPDGSYSNNGITAVINNGVITLNGTSTSTSFINIPINLSLNKTFSFSLNNTSMGDSSTGVRLQLTGSDYVFVGLNIANNKKENLNNYGTYETFMIRISSGITINNGIIKPMINEGTFAQSYEPYGEEICNNKIDDTNNKLDGIQGALTDTSTPNLEILGDTAGWLPPGPLDSVLNLPLTMMNNLLTNLGKTCSNLKVELPFVNKNIEIPCIESLMEKMGALVLWRWVGRIASIIILYSYLMNLYAWADKILTLRAEFDEAMGVDLANWGRL